MDEKLECEVDVERTVDMREKRYTVYSTVFVDEPMGETTTWHQASAPLPSFLFPPGHRDSVDSIADGLRGWMGRIELRRFINVLPGFIGDSPSIVRLWLSSNLNVVIVFAVPFSSPPVPSLTRTLILDVHISSSIHPS